MGAAGQRRAMSETAPKHDLHRRGSSPRPSVSVVEAVAAETGADPASLAPLYDVVDPDALDGLFEPGASGSVEFEFCGHDVAVHADGRVLVDGAERTGVAATEHDGSGGEQVESEDERVEPEDERVELEDGWSEQERDRP